MCIRDSQYTVRCRPDLPLPASVRQRLECDADRFALPFTVARQRPIAGCTPGWCASGVAAVIDRAADRLTEDYANANARRMWFDDKGMRVLSLWDPHHPMREVDLFVENPIDFDLLHERSQIVALATTSVRIASIEDLICLLYTSDAADERSSV